MILGPVATTGAFQKHWRPNVDVCELENCLEITVELAGVDPNRLYVQYSPERLLAKLLGCFFCDILYADFRNQKEAPN